MTNPIRYRPLLAASLSVAVILACDAQRRSDSGAAGAGDTTSIALANAPPCLAASAPVDYGTALAVSEEVRSIIDSYRAEWRAFCGADQRTPTPSLADILVTANRIAEAFDTLIRIHNRSRTTVELYAIADSVQDLLSVRYPRFVPGFEGSYFDHEYFRPATGEFLKYAVWGSVEDRAFFGAHIPLQTAYPPWLEKTWDYGGCLRFGDYNWTAALDTISALKQQLQSDVYKAAVSDYESAMIESISTTMGTNVCSCRSKEAVGNDLKSMVAYLGRHSELAVHLPAVRAKLDAVQSGRISVGSQAEKHCSGG